MGADDGSGVRAGPGDRIRRTGRPAWGPGARNRQRRALRDRSRRCTSMVRYCLDAGLRTGARPRRRGPGSSFPLRMLVRRGLRRAFADLRTDRRRTLRSSSTNVDAADANGPSKRPGRMRRLGPGERALPAPRVLQSFRRSVCAWVEDCLASWRRIPVCGDGQRWLLDDGAVLGLEDGGVTVVEVAGDGHAITVAVDEAATTQVGRCDADVVDTIGLRVPAGREAQE